MNIPDHISECLETIFGLKILEFFNADPESFDPGSGIQIPDSQQCAFQCEGKTFLEKLCVTAFNLSLIDYGSIFHASVTSAY
jgi:hypothetical protein